MNNVKYLVRNKMVRFSQLLLYICISFLLFCFVKYTFLRQTIPSVHCGVVIGTKP